MQTTLRTRALIMASAALILPAAAVAQEATTNTTDSSGAATPQAAAATPDGGIEDIVVTAQKRSSSVQKTPLAITAVGGSELRSREINSVEGLAPSLPNVNFGKNVGFARIAIRGIGLDTTVIGQEGRVAYHSDGIYVSRPTAAAAGFFDINRIEVVRGPQGTLYGRNATAGAVNVITNDPEAGAPHGYAKLTAGSYGLVQTEAAVTGGDDNLAARLALQTTDRGGYGHNRLLDEEIDNEHSYGVRGKLRFAPSSSFDITVSGDYSRQKDHAFVYHYLGAGGLSAAGTPVVPLAQFLGGTLPANPRDTNSDVPQRNLREFYGAGAVANADLGFAKLTSVTGYRHSFSNYASDADGGTNVVTATFRILERAHQFSEELRLAGDAGPVKYILGGYYFKETIFGFNNFSPLRSPAPPFLFKEGVDFRGTSKTRASAVFGQLEYEVLPQLTLTAGARYSHEKKSIDHVGMSDLVTNYNPNIPYPYTLFQVASETENSFTPRLGVEYRVAPDILLYATYAKGFKSGGYFNNQFRPPLLPEKLTDYEAGIKAEFLDHKLRTNLAGFIYDYSNLQLQQIQNGVAILLNAGRAVIRGVEGEVAVRPARNFELSGNASYLDSVIRDFTSPDPARLGPNPASPIIYNIDGNRLPQAPRYTANVAASYTVESSVGDFTLRGEASLTDRVYFSYYNRREVSQGGFAKYNAFLNFKNEDNGLTASLFIRNIANKRTISSDQVSAGFSRFPILGAFDPPRTYGASIGNNY